MALPTRTTQHTSQTFLRCAPSMTRCTAVSGHGAAVFSPLPASPAMGGCQRRFRRDVLSRRPFLHPAAPVRTAAAPGRVFRCRRSIGRLAQLCFRRAVRFRLARCRGVLAFFLPCSGSRPKERRMRRTSHQWWPAQGRRRFAPPCRPGREQLWPRRCAARRRASSCTAQSTIDGCRWTRHSPPPGSAKAGVLCRRAGRLGIPIWSTARVLTMHYSQT